MFFSFKKQFVSGFNFGISEKDTVIPDVVHYAGIFSSENGFTANANKYWQAKTNCWVTETKCLLPMSNVDGLQDSLTEKLDVLVKREGEQESENIDLYLFDWSTPASGVYENAKINEDGEIVEIDETEGYGTVVKKPYYVKPGTKIDLLSNSATIHFYDYAMKHLGYYAPTQTVTVPMGAYYAKMWCNSPFTSGNARDRFSRVRTNYLCQSAKLYYPDLAVDMSDENYTQVSNFLASGTGEVSRVLTTKTIQTTNRMRHAWRIASFNTYVGNRNLWTELKNFLQNYGIDIIGMQEVHTPLNPNSKGLTFEQALTSWHLSKFGILQTVNSCRPVATTSAFEVLNVEETKYTVQSGYGDRYFLKCELQLPDWNDKKWSDHLKLSIYNTQLEVSGTTKQTQIREMLTAVEKDPNPFIVIMGDFNDEAMFSKPVFQILENAGFAPVVSRYFDVTTETQGRSLVDNIFVNERIDCLGWDVIKPNYESLSLSDHDMVMGDLYFDYSNIVTVKPILTNCSLVGIDNWLDRRWEPVTITVVPDDGYTISSIEVGDGEMLSTASGYPNGVITISGNTITVDPTKVCTDMYIRATAKSE